MSLVIGRKLRKTPRGGSLLHWWGEKKKACRNKGGRKGSKFLARQKIVHQETARSMGKNYRSV